MNQKEKIIKDAKKLDIERENYRISQKEMITKVGEETQKLQRNAAHRKQLEDKLAVEQRDIERKQAEINAKEYDMKQLTQDLMTKEDQLHSYKKFTNFLQSVVNDKSGESFNDITDL